MKMKTYNVRFVTPAFLGDAEQKGAWRVPPFKALLRQWWRVVAAKECGYSHVKLREEECKLFGHAWLDTGRPKPKTWAMKSRVSLRLGRWEQGSLGVWPGDDPRVLHSEVERVPNHMIGSQLYLGFGPLRLERRVTCMKASPAIGTGEINQLSIGFPDEAERAMANVVQLIHWFGSIGGRSRNGWGSLVLEGDGVEGLQSLSGNSTLLQSVSRPLKECLSRDWPHAVGTDTRGLLIWRSQQTQARWSDVVRDLAEAKIKFRTALGFTKGQYHLEERHILAYPVTNHEVRGWEKERLANQLRFKVGMDQGKYLGIVYHLPCKLPDNLSGVRRVDHRELQGIQERQFQIWEKVHRSLDANTLFIRV